MSEKNQHSGHRNRMRKRFLASEPDNFYEHELLELLLFYVRPVINTNGLAHDLIERFGNLVSVIGADRKALESADGIGSEAALFLRLMNELSLDYLSRSHTDIPIRSSDELESYFRDYFALSDAELCCILCSGTSDVPVSIPTKELLSGTVTPRRLTEIMLTNRTNRIAVGINHPNGFPVPTDDEYKAARIFAELAPQISVDFADLIIHGKGRCFSMRKNGAFGFNGGRNNG